MGRGGAIAQFVQLIEKRLGWSWIGAAISVAIIVTATFVLFRLLREVDPARVFTAIGRMESADVLTATALVAVGYFVLTFYDFFTLRTIGRDEVPYRVAAFAAFTAYSIGHNLGAMVVTGGAVRLRVYSAWGLGLIDIAKIAFVTGLTFWLGNAVILGLALAYAPEPASAITQLPAWINRVIGLVGLAVIVGYLAWLLPQRRDIGRDGWRITLPNASLTLVQIGIGILDLGTGALAMFVLLPEFPPIEFSTVLVVFATAALLGFVSHAPGALGVFDAAILVALPQYQIESLLASLLVFRALYYILPFALAILLMIARELFTRGKRP